MPKVGARSTVAFSDGNAEAEWNGTQWVKVTQAGSSAKSGAQIAGELGYKKGTSTPPKPSASGGMSLADYAAKNRPKTLEEQAKAVEEEKKKRANQ